MGQVSQSHLGSSAVQASWVKVFWVQFHKASSQNCASADLIWARHGELAKRSRLELAAAEDPIIKVNAGGRLLQTWRSTLTSKSRYFANILDGPFNIDDGELSSIVVETSLSTFHIISVIASFGLLYHWKRWQTSPLCYPSIVFLRLSGNERRSKVW